MDRARDAQDELVRLEELWARRVVGRHDAQKVGEEERVPAEGGIKSNQKATSRKSVKKSGDLGGERPLTAHRQPIDSPSTAHPGGTRQPLRGRHSAATAALGSHCGTREALGSRSEAVQRPRCSRASKRGALGEPLDGLDQEGLERQILRLGSRAL